MVTRREVDGPIGRDAVRARLHRVVDDLPARSGRLVLVTGAAGIGKTTLLADTARHAERSGVPVVWGVGWSGVGAPGYWPWIQVMRALDPATSAFTGATAPGGDVSTIPGPVGPGGEASTDGPAARFRLFDRVTSTLLARGPLVVILDDLQWADPPSLRLLDFVSRRLPSASCAVIAAYRVEAVGGEDADDPLAEIAARSTVIPLTGLADDAVAALYNRVAGHPPDPERAAELRRRTGGNPFFVEQVAMLPPDRRDDVPPGVREALRQRLAGRSDDDIAILSAAAVIGRAFPADLLAETTGTAPEPTLTDAARAGLVAHDSGGTWRFSHDLLRDYLYQRLDPPARAETHRRVGEALEARRDQGADIELAELAEHFVRADPTGAPARRHLTAAAREATERLAYEQAVRHWERVLPTLADDPDARTDALLLLARARQRSGAGKAATEAYALAVDSARRTGNRIHLARAALGRHALGAPGAVANHDLIALLDEALAGLDAAGDPEPALRLRLLATLARILSWHDIDPVAARDHAARAVAGARALGDRATLAACLVAEHNAQWAPDTVAARIVLADEITALAIELDDRELLMESRLLAATDRLEAADPTFRRALDDYLRLAETSPEPRFRYAAAARRAMLATLAGRLDEADALIEAAAELGRECGEPGAATVRAEQLWELRTAQGRRGELAELADVYAGRGSWANRGFAAMIDFVVGRDTRGAEALAAEWADDPDRSTPGGRRWLIETTYGATLAAMIGNAPLAARLGAELAPYAGQAVVIGASIAFKGVVDHHLGVAADAAGQPDAARAHFAAAVRHHEALGARAWAATSRFHLARLRLDDPATRAAALDDLAAVSRDARRMGLAQLARDAEAAGGLAGVVDAPVTGVFRRDGTLWTLSFGDRTVRMRDAKGLRDLAALLAKPGTAVAAADLVAAGLVAAGAAEAVRADLGLGADEVFDETARRQIRARLAQLDDDVAEAELWSDPERAHRARAERDAIIEELTAATGLGGSARRLGDQWERARKAVTARIRDVLDRVEKVHPPLAAHLRAHVTTGSYCAYSPTGPTDWAL